MRLQAFVKVQSALNGIDDGSDDQENCDDRKSRQRLADRFILGHFLTVPDADKLKNKVCKCCKVEYLKEK